MDTYRVVANGVKVFETVNPVAAFSHAMMRQQNKVDPNLSILDKSGRSAWNFCQGEWLDSQDD